jgi:hypothetical protein
VWTFYANLTQDGGTWARLPLLNPLDLVQAVIFALAAFWLVRIHRLGVPMSNIVCRCRWWPARSVSYG